MEIDEYNTKHTWGYMDTIPCVLSMDWVYRLSVKIPYIEKFSQPIIFAFFTNWHETRKYLSRNFPHRINHEQTLRWRRWNHRSCSRSTDLFVCYVWYSTVFNLQSRLVWSCWQRTDHVDCLFAVCIQEFRPEQESKYPDKYGNLWHKSWNWIHLPFLLQLLKVLTLWMWMMTS